MHISFNYIFSFKVGLIILKQLNTPLEKPKLSHTGSFNTAKEEMKRKRRKKRGRGKKTGQVYICLKEK